MHIFVSNKPCILLETVELLYAFANGIPAQDLTTDNSWSIPAWDVERIMKSACAGLDWQDPVLQFFFGREPLADESGSYTCIAKNLTYTMLDFSQDSLKASFDKLQKWWKNFRTNQERILTISKYGFDYASRAAKGFAPLSQDLDQLLVSPAYQMRLLETLVDSQQYLHQLEQLMSPPAERLEGLLAPWVQRTEPLASLWQDIFSRPNLLELLQNRWQLSAENQYDAIHAVLRYLDCAKAPGQLDDTTNLLSLHIGLGYPIQPDNPEPEIENWELKALRLLGSPARFKMLRSMHATPMTAREISQQLDLHIGTVCRDVSSMFDARLLIVESADDRRRYRTNTEAIDVIMQHLSLLK